MGGTHFTLIWFVGGEGLTNERPGNWSWDLRANENPRKKAASDGANKQTDKQTDIATLWLTRPRGPSQWKFMVYRSTVKNIHTTFWYEILSSIIQSNGVQIKLLRHSNNLHPALNFIYGANHLLQVVTQFLCKKHIFKSWF